VLYLHGVLPQHSPSSDFGENQLSRGLISLSLLLSSHLRIFQHSRVRSFIWCYPNFNLLKSRSPPLRVYCPRLGRAVDTRFPFASTAKRFRLATDNNSQTHYAKGKQSPAPFDGRRTKRLIVYSWELIDRSPKRRSKTIHYQLGTISFIQPSAEWSRLLHIVGIWFQVLFHSPNRGSFHLSLAVLVHYRLPRSI
jgi:hypothetical protein